MTFDDLAKRLTALESDKHRITQVFHPEAGRIWHGIFSSAVVTESTDIAYVTSDGKRHPL